LIIIVIINILNLLTECSQFPSSVSDGYDERARPGAN